MLLRLLFAAVAVIALLTAAAWGDEPQPLLIEETATAGEWDIHDAQTAQVIPPQTLPSSPDAYAWKGPCLRTPELIIGPPDDV